MNRIEQVATVIKEADEGADGLGGDLSDRECLAIAQAIENAGWLREEPRSG